MSVVVVVVLVVDQWPSFFLQGIPRSVLPSESKKVTNRTPCNLQAIEGQQHGPVGQSTQFPTGHPRVEHRDSFLAPELL